MSDTPVGEPERSGPRADGAQGDEEAGETVAFLPPWLSRGLILGWVLLFAGRWLVVQGMAAASLIGPEQVDSLDEKLLGRIYLLLLSVTLVTLALRIARGLQADRGSLGSGSTPPAGPAAAAEAAASDRGGKQA